MNAAALLPASAVAPLADASRSGATAAVASSCLARRQGLRCLAVGVGVCKQGGLHRQSCSLKALPSRASAPGMETMAGSFAKCVQRFALCYLPCAGRQLLLFWLHVPTVTPQLPIGKQIARR